MTRQQAKELLPIIQAYSEGKNIEFLNIYDNWKDAEENLELTGISSNYRIKKEPQYRPWTPEEVPVGALISPSSAGDKRMMILEYDDDYVIRICCGQLSNISCERLLSGGFHYSIDFGKTWQPCGVLQ